MLSYVGVVNNDKFFLFLFYLSVFLFVLIQLLHSVAVALFGSCICIPAGQVDYFEFIFNIFIWHGVGLEPGLLSDTHVHLDSKHYNRNRQGGPPIGGAVRNATSLVQSRLSSIILAIVCSENVYA